MAKRKVDLSQFNSAELRTLATIALLITNNLSFPRQQEAAIELLAKIVEIFDVVQDLEVFTTVLALIEKHSEMRRYAMVEFLSQGDALVALGEAPVM